jgi:hypothetical protein
MRLGEAAAIAGALAHGGDFDLLEIVLEFAQLEFEGRRGGLAADAQPPSLGIASGMTARW